jgi:DNA-binding FadR family transcriptional regulator
MPVRPPHSHRGTSASASPDGDATASALALGASLSNRARSAAGEAVRPKTGEALARRIEQEVINDGWPVGRCLGTEPELLERYGVSRSVLREAIRLLEHHMVARMRRGPGGGLIVTAPDGSSVTTAAALFLDFERVEPAHLHNARSVIELKCVELAMEHLTPAGERRLREILTYEAQYEPVELVARSHELHMTIADLSGDPALRLFMQVLMTLTGEHAPPAERTARDAGDQLREARCAHVDIVEAITDGTYELARTRMLEHLSWIARGMQNVPEPHRIADDR